MVLALERQTLLTTRSDRVKCVDLHSTEPWMLCSLYNGKVTIWNYETQTLIRTIDVCDQQPIRAARFVARKSWVITGSDDLSIRIFDYHTSELVHHIEGAHGDYIRDIAVHPIRPLIISCSDDMSIKEWNWDQSWKCVCTHEGHHHYVMAVAFNPKDHGSTFASGSLDHTIRIWSLGNPNSNYALEGHEKGVNSIAYYPSTVGGDNKPYLVSGSDDCSVSVWDLPSKARVRQINAHQQNVSAVAVHPNMPLILSASEDGTVKAFNINTFRQEHSMNMDLDRLWSIAINHQVVAAAGDEGASANSLGSNVPAAHMESSSGRMVYSKGMLVHTAQLTQVLEEDDQIADGERILVSPRELGTCDVYPQSVLYSSNGRFIAVIGDGEYIIYTALAWRNKAYGKGLEVTWAADSTDYAVRESGTRITLFHEFEPNGIINTHTTCHRIFGGVLIGASTSDGQLSFFDWNTCSLIRNIEVAATQVYWSACKTLLAVCAKDAFYILRYNADAVQHGQITEDGIEDAFEVIMQVDEAVHSGVWIDGAFLYLIQNRGASRLCVTIPLENYKSKDSFAQTVAVIPEKNQLFLIGFIPSVQRAVLVDKEANVCTYQFSTSIVAYSTAILNNDLNAAAQILPKIPLHQLDRLARFLDQEGHSQLAMDIAKDPDFIFDLAIKLNQLDRAKTMAEKLQSSAHWRELADAALITENLSLVEHALLQCNDDISTMHLLYFSRADVDGLRRTALLAQERNLFATSFACFFSIGALQECYDLLMKSERYPEAAFFANCYFSNAQQSESVIKAVQQWKNHLCNTGRHRAAGLVASPADHPDLFVQSTAAAPPVIPHSSIPPASRNRNPSVDSGRNASVMSAATFGGSVTSEQFSILATAGSASMYSDDIDDLPSVNGCPSESTMSRNLDNLCLEDDDGREFVVDNEDLFEDSMQPPTEMLDSKSTSTAPQNLYTLHEEESSMSSLPHQHHQQHESDFAEHTEKDGWD